MADDSSLEKFVLQYHVEMQDAVKRLEELNEKIQKTNDTSKKGGDGFKSFVKDATSEVGKFVPAIDKVTSVTDKMTKGFVVAGVALTALAVSMRAMQNLANEYEKQRKTGYNTGMSAVNVEMLQRSFNSATGRMSGDASRTLIEKTASMAHASYTDTNPWNADALKLSNAGSSAYGKDGKIKGTDQILDDMTAKFKSVSSQQAAAIGQSIGFTQDETKAIRERNLALTTLNATSQSSAARTYEANMAMEKVSSASGQIRENFRQMSDTLGQELMPVLADFLEWAGEVTKDLPADLDAAFSIWHRINMQFQAAMEVLQDYKKAWNPAEYTKAMAGADTQWKKQQEANAAAAAKQDESARLQYQTSSQFQKNVNLFASAVNSFSGAISDQQAIAAWAGSAGAAGGLAGLGGGRPQTAAMSGGANANAFGGYTGATRPSAYDTDINAAAAKYNVPVDLIKGVIGAESSFNPNAKSKVGANGLMQVMGFNGKGGEDLMNPSVNINRGTAILRENLDIAARRGYKGEEAVDMALKYYNGGPGFRPNKETNEYPSRVREWQRKAQVSQYQPTDGLRAETRFSAQMSPIMQTVAGRVGVPVEQLMQGGVPKSDIAWAVRQIQVESTNARMAAASRVMAPGALPQQKAAAYREMMEAENNYNNLKTYGRTAVGQGTGSETDARKFTTGLPDISVIQNFYGVTGDDLINRAKEAGQAASKEIVNATSNSVVK